MPVRCKSIGGKYRIVGPNGKIETTDGGNAVDGGGHPSEAACLKQAAAINRNLSVYGIGHEGALPVTAGSRSLSNDVSTQAFKKDMLKVGVYEHPVYGWTMDVTEERLHRFVAAFGEMKANGVDVEIPIDHSDSATNNLGYVIDMFVEDDEDGVSTLYGIHEIRGEEAIGIVSRNRNVSVAIEREFKDGKGNSYGEVIVHSSVVQQPILPGQNDFEPVSVAASRGATAGKIPVFTLSKETRSTNMDEKMLKAIKELLGAGDEVTADNVLSRLEQRFKEGGEKLSTLTEEVVNLKGKVESLEASKSKDGDDKKASKIDRNLAEQMGTTAEQQLSLLVDGGKITPAVKDKLCKVLVGEAGSRNVIALSIGAENKPSLLTAVVDALKDNDVIELNEKTGVQVLSRQVPGVGDKVTEAKEEQEVQDEMIVMADGTEEKEKTAV